MFNLNLFHSYKINLYLKNNPTPIIGILTHIGKYFIELDDDNLYSIKSIEKISFNGNNTFNK